MILQMIPKIELRSCGFFLFPFSWKCSVKIFHQSGTYNIISRHSLWLVARMIAIVFYIIYPGKFAWISSILGIIRKENEECARDFTQYIVSGGLRRRIEAYFKSAVVLSMLHASGLVYCDLSANNLFICVANILSQSNLWERDFYVFRQRKGSQKIKFFIFWYIFWISHIFPIKHKFDSNIGILCSVNRPLTSSVNFLCSLSFRIENFMGAYCVATGLESEIWQKMK